MHLLRASQGWWSLRNEGPLQSVRRSRNSYRRAPMCLSYVQTFCHVGSSHLTLPQSTLLNTHPLDLDPREKKLCNTQDKTLRIVASISRTEPLLPSIHFILPLQGFVALCNEIKLSTPTSIFATAASNRSADNLFVLGVQRRKSRHHGGCFQ